MNKEPSWSVVLIAKNESKTLPRLIESLKEFQERGGEIIVVDTGSTDDTVKIARNLGCVVSEVGNRFVRVIDKIEADLINDAFVESGEELIVQPNDTLFNFSDARNYAASLAKNDMVSMPDCDEIFTALDIDAINELIRQGVQQLEYNFVFSHDRFGNEEIKFLHSKFYNRKISKWVRIVHEVLSSNTIVTRKWVSEEIIKLEHWQNQEQNRSGYLKGLAYDCFIDSTSDRNYHYFGRELYWSGRPKTAIKVLEKHLQISNWSSEKSQSMLFIGDSFMSLGNVNSALDWYHRAFLEDSSNRKSFIKLAEYFYSVGDAQRCIVYAEAALTISMSQYFVVDKKDYSYYPHEMLYWAYWVLGNKEKSREHFDIAFSYAPDNPKYLEDYRWYHPIPTVSIIIPTLGTRQNGMKELLSSIDKLNYPQELIERVIVADDVLNPQGVSKTVKKGAERAKGEWIVFAADDMTFEPNCLIQAFIKHVNTGKRLISFNSGVGLIPNEGFFCEHFMIHRSLIPKIGGEIFDTEIFHVGVDTLLWEKCKKMNEADRAEKAIVFHNHFSRPGKEELLKSDSTYSIGWKHSSQDREILERKLAELKE